MRYTLKFSWRREWLMIGISLLACLFFMSLMPKAGSHALRAGASAHSLSKLLSLPVDKILHISAYFLLMLWFVPVLRRGRRLWFAVFLIMLGGALEVLQGLSGYRSCDSYDFAANVVGVTMAWALTRLNGLVL